MKYLAAAFLLTISPIFLSAQNVGINSTGATPTASSILDLNTGNTFTSPNGKGLLPPNVALTSITDAVTITTPATSLLVYNTATAGVSPNNVIPGFYYWNGTKWVAFNGTGSNNWALLGNAGTTAGTNFIGTTDANDLVFKTNNAESMRIANISGYVGIGVVNPSTQLANTSLNTLDLLSIGISTSSIAWLANGHGYVASLVNTDASLFGRNGLLIKTVATDVFSYPLQINVGNNNALTVRGDGNVGIGTITPSFNLDVKGSERLVIFAEGTQTATDNANQAGIISVTTFSPTASTLNCAAVGGWGTFSPPAGVTITNAAQLYAQQGVQSGAGTITNGYGLYVNAPVFGTNRYSAYFQSSVGIGCTNPTQALYVTGNIYATGTVLGGQAACSDVRWKKDFKPLNNSLNKIVQLSGYYYHFKTDEFPDKHFSNDLQIGMKAQEVEKLFPEILFTDKEGYKYLDYSRLTPILVEAIKEQQKIIDSQQAEINSLQAENKNFKTQYDNRLNVLEAILTARASK